MFQNMIKLQVEDLLKARGKTLYWLAGPSGADVEYGSLWRLKEGRAKSISFDLMNRLCKALECQPGDIFVYTEGAEPVKRPAKKRSKRAE